MRTGGGGGRGVGKEVWGGDTKFKKNLNIEGIL